jgi:methionine aminotransferase
MSKLPNIGTSIFTIISKMAAQHNAINRSQGFPTIAVDKRLTDIVAKLASDNVHQYTPISGSPLLDTVARRTQQSYQRAVNPIDEILITAGATEGIFATIQAFVFALLKMTLCCSKRQNNCENYN